MKIRILDLAERDLQAGFSFYETQHVGIGDFFLDSIYSEIDSLLLYAGIHRKIFGYHRQLCRRFPFAIYYKLDGGEVFVWRVLDLRRDPIWIQKQIRPSG
ncbi:MAG: type II toxin-antitoxin system RelE/ParE family toxin [Terrimicrobiaceae bacterium]